MIGYFFLLNSQPTARQQGSSQRQQGRGGSGKGQRKAVIEHQAESAGQHQKTAGQSEQCGQIIRFNAYRVNGQGREIGRGIFLVESTRTFPGQLFKSIITVLLYGAPYKKRAGIAAHSHNYPH